MEIMQDEVTLDEFKLFYGLDRELYSILVRDLSRNPSECLQIMGLWLWLERGGFNNIISKIVTLTPTTISQLADEASACLTLINTTANNNDHFLPPSPERESKIPLSHTILKTNVSLRYLQENSRTIFHEVQTLVSNVYIPALSDIMEKARHGGFSESPTQNRTTFPGRASPGDPLVQNFSTMSIEGGDSPPSRGRTRGNETPRFPRTMFATFSKGYPVSEIEVRRFFTMMLGNCIDSFHMQEVRHDEQPLYARVVFLSSSFIQLILNGETKAKFTINGKHVWMRQFVPRNGRMLPCGCPTVGPSTCPHH